jgi:hypothetical protein
MVVSTIVTSRACCNNSPVSVLLEEAARASWTGKMWSSTSNKGSSSGTIGTMQTRAAAAAVAVVAEPDVLEQAAAIATAAVVERLSSQKVAALVGGLPQSKSGSQDLGEGGLYISREMLKLSVAA